MTTTKREHNIYAMYFLILSVLWMINLIIASVTHTMEIDTLHKVCTIIFSIIGVVAYHNRYEQ